LNQIGTNGGGGQRLIVRRASKVRNRNGKPAFENLSGVIVTATTTSKRMKMFTVSRQSDIDIDIRGIEVVLTYWVLWPMH